MNYPQIVESPIAPLNPELILPTRIVDPIRSNKIAAEFLERETISHQVALGSAKGNRLRLAIDKDVLLKEGTLLVRSLAGPELLRIPWRPGHGLLSEPTSISPADAEYFHEVEQRHPMLAAREHCDVTFVIPAKNGAAYLKRTLAILKTQDALGSHEVIVIDSGSKDNTPEIAVAENALLVQISPAEFGHGRTRNLGAYLARGEFVCFLNGDAVPMDDQWFVSMKRYFKDPAVKGVCSRQVPRKDCDPLRKSELLNWPIPAASADAKMMRIDSLQDFLLMKPMEKRRLLCFETVSCLVRRSDIIANPFPHCSFGEDFRWAKYMLENGARLVFEPLSRIEHSHDFYRSALGAMRRAFDDHYLLCSTIGPLMEPSLTGFVRLVAFHVMHDWLVIAKDSLAPSSKLGWLLWIPFVDTCKVLGMAVACSRVADSAATEKLFSSVARIKAQ